jgi:(p)ppGpp synthase/HD superfamily hydrolase
MKVKDCGASVLVGEARKFAVEAHSSQKYGEHQYEKHLADVVQVLEMFQPDYDFDEHIFAAAWLHDTIEDTPATVAEIRSKFGAKTAQLVYAVTNELGRNRKERTVKTMLKVWDKGKEAMAIKLADRIANTQFSRSQRSPQFEMYKKEYPFFRWFLKKGGELRKMWDLLDKLVED